MSTFKLNDIGISIAIQNPKIISQGLISHWSFNEGNGNILHDFGGSNNDGTFVLPTWAGVPAGNTRNRSLYFYTGAQSYVSVPFNSTLSPNTGDWTVSFWIFYSGATGDYPQIIGSRPWNAGKDIGWSICISSVSSQMCSHFTDGSTGWDVDGGGSIYTAGASASTTTLSSWTHWVFVFSRSTSQLLIYRNGVLDATRNPTWPTGAVNITSNVYIGRDVLGGNFRQFGGYMNEILVYNRALSSAEASSLYSH